MSDENDRNSLNENTSDHEVIPEEKEIEVEAENDEDAEENVEDAEENIGEEEENVEEEEIPEVYLSEDLISSAFISDACTLPADIIDFHHSFGYSCKRPFNLSLVDPHTVIFASGNFINFLDTDTREIWFRRSAGGGGIGHIAKNPVLPHIAVGETGDNPLIIIYEWPSLDVVSVMRDGTTNAYTHLDYSPDGDLLCSQGAEPDFMLTIWNWRKSRIMLRRKSYNQPVTNVMFSPYNAELLTSSGVGHIKFWKMAKTFTGLKLIGELGRFGKTEMSDIVGLLPLSDEKVLSGCTWGNMLLWDEGLIKLEAYKRGRQKCHQGVVVQMWINGKSLLSIGTDGGVVDWDFRVIENADPPAEDLSVELNPQMQFEVGNSPGKTAIISMVKLKPHDPKDFNWFAQDGKGGIWKAIINTIGYKTTDEQIFFCHEGQVMDMASAPCGSYFASIGQGGRIHFYNYMTKTLLVRQQFSAPGSCLLWLPLQADSSGKVLVAGFADGVVRVFVASMRVKERFMTLDSEFLALIQVIKPHTKPIKALSISSEGDLLVSGSEDATVFVFAVQHKEYVNLVPIGYVEIPSAVTSITWKPGANSTLLVGCMFGEVLEMILPRKPASQSVISYKLEDVSARSIVFKSIKSQIHRDIKLKQIQEKKNKKIERKKVELQKIMANNPGLDFDEDTFMADSDEEEVQEPLYIPKVPNRVLFATYTPLGTVWLSMAGYDAGYIYEYDLDYGTPLSCTIIHDAEYSEIHSFAYNHNGKYLLFGMNDGKIRVNRVNPEDFRDLKDYWLLGMHDNRNGDIHRICFSNDDRYLFSCGADGNVFVYQFHPEDEESIREFVPAIETAGVPRASVRDITNTRALSLEQMKFKIDYDRRMAIAEQRKKVVLKSLKKLANDFAKVLKRNDALPPSQKFFHEDFLIDERINNDLVKQFEEDMDLTKRKNIFTLAKSELGAKKLQEYYLEPLEALPVKIRALCSSDTVVSMRQRKLPQELDKYYAEVKARLAETERRNRLQQREILSIEPMAQERPLRHIDSFLRGLSKNSEVMKKQTKLRTLIERYMVRQVKWEIREGHWFKLNQRKPDPTVYHPKDVIAYERAQQTIGDYKLKSAADYRVPLHLRMTTNKKYDHLLEIRKINLYRVHEKYIGRVMGLRETKMKLLQEIGRGKHTLARLQVEIEASRDALARHMEEAIQEEKSRKMPVGDQAGKKVMKKVKIQLPTTNKSPRDQAEKKKQELAKQLEKTRKASPGGKVGKKIIKNKTQEARKLPASNKAGKLKKVKMSVPLPTEKPQMPTVARSNLADEYPERYLLLSGKPQKRIKQATANRAMEEEYEALLLKGQHFPVKRCHADPPISPLKYLCKDARETRWEATLKTKRLEKVMFDQMKIVEDLKKKLKKYDEDICDTQNSQTEVLIEAKFLELFILGLNQELIILKTFERREEVLSSKVNERLNKDLDMRETVNGLIRDIDLMSRDIYKLGEREREFTAEFMEATAYNRFRKPLLRIYKKRYRPPGQDDSSSSSSSSDEGDAKSVDSLDIAGMHTDETHCPEGCDKDLFQLTFTLRTGRHQVEIRVSEMKKALENVKRALVTAKAQQKVLETALLESQETLEAFQREKQQKLNEVEVVVILKPEQLRHFTEDHDLAHLSDTLVFSKNALKSLLLRSADLDKETESQDKKFKDIRARSRQIKIDCRLIEGDIRNLKQDIVDCKIKKFGSVVDITFLEQIVLRRMIATLRTNFDDYKKEQDKIAGKLSKKLHAREDRLCCVIKENTEKLNLLLVLEREKHMLAQILYTQEKKKQKAISYVNPYVEDNVRLSEIVSHQAKEIQVLKHEIHMLTSKTETRHVLPIAEPVSESPHFPELPRVSTAQTHTTEVSQEEGPIIKASDSSTPIYIRRFLDEVLSNLPDQDARKEAGLIIESILDRLPSDTSETSIQSIRATMERIVYGILDNIGEPAPSPTVTVSEEYVREFLEDILGNVVVSVDEKEDVMMMLEIATSQLTTDNRDALVEEVVEQLAERNSEETNYEEETKLNIEDIINDIMTRIFPRMGHSFRQSRNSIEQDLLDQLLQYDKSSDDNN